MKLIPILLALASTFLAVGASAQPRPLQDPDAAYTTPQPSITPIPGQRLQPPPLPQPPRQLPIWLMVILIGGLGGTAAYAIYKLVHRPDSHTFPPKHHFEAKVGEINQEIVVDKAIANMALYLRVFKDAGKQELVAEEPMIPEKDKPHA